MFNSDVSESLAIYESLLFLKEMKIIDKNTKIEVISDSLSNVSKLNFIGNIKSPFIEEALKLCNRYFKDNYVKFKWIKGF